MIIWRERERERERCCALTLVLVVQVDQIGTCTTDSKLYKDNVVIHDIFVSEQKENIVILKSWFTEISDSFSSQLMRRYQEFNYKNRTQDH